MYLLQLALVSCSRLSSTLGSAGEEISEKISVEEGQCIDGCNWEGDTIVYGL